jgi:hypothetical protein
MRSAVVISALQPPEEVPRLMVVLSRLSAGLSVIGVEGSARLAKLAPHVQIIDPVTRYANNAEWRADWPRLLPLLHRVLPSLRILRHRTHTRVGVQRGPIAFRRFPKVVPEFWR